VAAENDLAFVRRVLALLHDAGVDAWVFGGWAAELLGLAPPRPHQDVDLLYPAETFERVDAAIGELGLAEIEGKRFPHKRAFVLDGVMVELFLVKSDRYGQYTEFWGRVRHDWPADLLGTVDGVRVASAAGLASHRSAHEALRMTS
jgi:hypothetical protein